MNEEPSNPKSVEPPQDVDRADLHKHLEFVQAIIARLANNSFLMKGWALTISSALLGYAVANLSWPVAALGLLPGASFWFLDSYYLRQERMFRCLYRDVALGTVSSFSLNVEQYRTVVSRRNTFTSETLKWFYGTILMVATSILISIVVANAAVEPEVDPAPQPSPGSAEARYDDWPSRIEPTDQD